MKYNIPGNLRAVKNIPNNIVLANLAKISHTLIKVGLQNVET